MSFDFSIHYHKDSLNPADESSHQTDYNVHLADPNNDQFQISRLMPSLENKLATAALGTGEQF